MIYLFIALWFISGGSSFVFWWTKDYDLKLGPELIVLFFATLAGPLSFIIGACIHGDEGGDRGKILMRRRDQ